MRQCACGKKIRSKNSAAHRKRCPTWTSYYERKRSAAQLADFVANSPPASLRAVSPFDEEEAIDSPVTPPASAYHKSLNMELVPEDDCFSRFEASLLDKNCPKETVQTVSTRYVTVTDPTSLLTAHRIRKILYWLAARQGWTKLYDYEYIFRNQLVSVTITPALYCTNLTAMTPAACLHTITMTPLHLSTPLTLHAGSLERKCSCQSLSQFCGW